MNERLRSDLTLTWSLYEQLGALSHVKGRPDTDVRTMPGSTVPIHVAAVDHMSTLELFIDPWITRARWIRSPSPIWHLSLTTGVVCPVDGCAQPSLDGKPTEQLILCRSCGARWRGQDEWNFLGRLLADQNPHITIPELSPGRGANLRGARPRWDVLGALIVEPRDGAA